MPTINRYRLAAFFCAFIIVFTGVLPPSFQPPEVQAAEKKQQKYTCSMHPFIIEDHPGNCPICGMKLVPVKNRIAVPPAAKKSKKKSERKIKYWKAPMDPTYIRDSPGKSPMGMDLVPVYEDEAQSGSTISIDPVTIQNMGIRTVQVKRRNLSHIIHTVGLVRYEEPLQYIINTKISGWIEKLYANQKGQKIKKGEPLLKIYSPELVSTQQEFLLALHNKKALANNSFPVIAQGARQLLEAARRRLELWDISKQQIEALEKNQKVQKTITIYSPYSGIITRKDVNEGTYARAGTELLAISDISRVWINADIYESDLPWVKTGLKATVTLPFADSRKLYGRLTFLYPYMEAKTRTMKARLEFNNPGLILKPDMYVNVQIMTRPLRNVLTIPENAVLNSGDSKTVFVDLGKGKFEPRQIKTGLAGQNGLVQVRQGLLENEWVVTSAQFMLDSESNLRAAVQSMLEVNKKKMKMPAAPKVDKKAKKENLKDLF
ncbi:efflux RND transporter periplasmic adaptor subunit [Desulfobacterota bacterium M19]